MHLPEDCPRSMPHSDPSCGGPHRHLVNMQAGSRLEEIYGGSELLVNSNHHQAIREIGPRFRLAATAPDGVVEAIEAAAKACELNAWRADPFAYTGTAINDVIYDGLRKADYVVVDLTGARPNVYFEAGYAHALGKAPFYIAKDGTKVEFDVSGYPVLFYTSMKQLREDLTQRVQARVNATTVAADR